MSESEVISRKEVREGDSCSKGKVSDSSSLLTGNSGSDQVLILLAEAVEKIDKLTGTVNMLQNNFAAQNKRLDKLQPSSNEASDRDPAPMQQTNLKASKSRSKNNRVERQVKVSQHKTSSRGINIVSDISSSFWDSSPEKEPAHKGLDRKTKNERKGHSSYNIPSKGRQSRNIVYEDSSDSNYSSDWGLCDKDRHSRRSRTIK